MKTIDLKENGVVELSFDEMKQVEGGFIIALILGVWFGYWLYEVTHQEE